MNITVEGKIVKSEGTQDFELKASSIKLEGDCPDDYPLQAKGRPESQNSIYFVSSAFSVLSSVEVQYNAVENITIQNDVISWEDDRQIGKYILDIVETNQNEYVTTKTIVVTGNSYDLSNAELSGDNDSTYQISIKTCGDSRKLSSLAEVQSKTFKALNSIADVKIENGYIAFKAQANAKSYTVGIRLVNDTHYYKIEYLGGSYVVTNLTLQRVVNSSIVYEQKSVENEIDVFESNGYIYFWPQTPPMTSGSYLSVRTNGYEDDDTIYISSLYTKYSQQISKLNIEKASIYKIVYENGYLTSFNIFYYFET